MVITHYGMWNMCVEGRRTQLDKTQGGLQRGSQDLTKGEGGGGLQYFINFYVIKNIYL